MSSRGINVKKILISFMLGLAMIFSCFTPKAIYALDEISGNNDVYSISQGIRNQDNTLKTIKGYVVGQPTSYDRVITSGYIDDNAIAIADSDTETNTSNMIYVKISSKYRSSFGLKTNPNLKGKQVSITGYLTSYFAHYGLKEITDIKEVISSSSDEDIIDTNLDKDNSKVTDDKSKEDITNNNKDNENSTSNSNNYYADAVGKGGKALKASLHEIIDDHKKLSYAGVWNALMDTDEDPDNKDNVILLYTGRSQSKTTKGSAVNDWNREHVWAKSHGNFGTKAGPGTDLHHLRPTDVSVNSSRGNLDFDNGGTSHEEATLCKYDNDSWEPRDSVKGDIARMLFYMDVRYEGDNGEIDLELNDKVNNGSNPCMGKLSTLLKWNEQDPVDQFEKTRNDIIYEKYQYNRNPFIDHPEWANEIWN